MDLIHVDLTVGGQQFWLGPGPAGQPVTLWADTTVVHLLHRGVRVKTVPFRLTIGQLHQLLADDGRPAGPPPIPTGPVQKVGPAAGVAQLFNRPDFPGETLSGRLGDAIFFGLLFGVFLPGLLLLLPRIAGPMADLLPAESIQVERMIRDCQPGEDVKLRAAAVAVCRYRMRGNGPITMVVLVVGLAGMAVWAVLRRDFGDAVLTVGLLAFMPWSIHSARQSQARFRAFLAVTTPE